MNNYDKVLTLMEAVKDNGYGALNYAKANALLKKFHGNLSQTIDAIAKGHVSI